MDKQLRAVLGSNNGLLEDVRKRGLSGPLEEDQEAWLGPENDNMKRWLKAAGFPELVPQIVLDQPSLGTWEDVRRAARKFSQNIDVVLRSELLADVQHLRESAAEEAERVHLPSERLGSLHAEGIEVRDAEGERGFGDPVLEAAAQSNEVAKWTMKVEKTLQNVAPDLQRDWRVKVSEWDSHPSGLDRLDERLELLDAFVARLRARESI